VCFLNYIGLGFIQKSASKISCGGKKMLPKSYLLPTLISTHEKENFTFHVGSDKYDILLE
jgi:hypothetical protein